MRTKASILAMAVLLACALPLLADDRPDEGKITAIDFDQRMMVVQGDNGDQWMLYWTETTKLKHDLTVSELKPGDTVHFDYVEREGKKFLTELHRTHKAGKD
jgi:hypothetical protein